jgi:hypothetical protein
MEEMQSESKVLLSELKDHIPFDRAKKDEVLAKVDKTVKNR